MLYPPATAGPGWSATPPRLSPGPICCSYKSKARGCTGSRCESGAVAQLSAGSGWQSATEAFCLGKAASSVDLRARRPIQGASPHPPTPGRATCGRAGADLGLSHIDTGGDEVTGSRPPLEPPPRGRARAPSVVIVNTSDCKGKSTAAFGTAMRAIARGWRVCVVQFIKSGRWKVGEVDRGVRAIRGIDF